MKPNISKESIAKVKEILKQQLKVIDNLIKAVKS